MEEGTEADIKKHLSILGKLEEEERERVSPYHFIVKLKLPCSLCTELSTTCARRMA